MPSPFKHRPPPVRLVTFDAFGTLFYPSPSIQHQYALAAQKHGINISAEELKPHFKTAFKDVIKRRPNYGRDQDESGLPEDWRGWQGWWHELIHRTFVHANGKKPPVALGHDLLHRFSSSEGYKLHDDTLPLLKHLHREHPFVLLGVISNSDPRIPLVLDSLGISKYFALTTLSYDVGHEKPHGAIFEAALNQANKVRPVMEGTKDTDIAPTECIHVGDDKQQDIEGAKAAGWRSIWMQRGEDFEATSASSLMDVVKIIEGR
ncbi:hypothetical protein YB2330_003210 [Saitoella coloradoensis]